MQNIIIKPIITEKSIALANAGKFTFMVEKSAGKPAIKQVIESTFNVKVKAIVTALVKGKTKRVGTKRLEIVMSPWKKAVVLLEKGQKIDLFELAG